MENTINHCLDELDKSYGEMSQILELPLFMDTTEVRQVIGSIKRARDSVLYVANAMSLKYQEQEDDETEDDQENPN